MGFRLGVVSARSFVGNARSGLTLRGDYDDPAPIRNRPKGFLQMAGGDIPTVRRKIDERVAQRPSVAQRREIADEAVRVHPVGGTQIRHPKHRFARKVLSGGQDGRVSGLKGGELRKGVSCIVIRHARQFRTT
ncbi:hypothetical protein BST16_20145 [Mycobacterium asiaticum DSM 44297]|nr:hypothetical protein BST16_20145 [Mycobacterium asiaticum DSM 44297]